MVIALNSFKKKYISFVGINITINKDELDKKHWMLTIGKAVYELNGCIADNEADPRNHTDLCWSEHFKANCDDKSAI